MCLACQEAEASRPDRADTHPSSPLHQRPYLDDKQLTTLHIMSHFDHRRSRSPSGGRHEHHPRISHHTRRSGSPRPHHRSSKRKRSRSPTQPPTLPFQSSSLSKHDFRTYKPMFALYLDIQKQLILEDLSEDEVRGRWKSFLGKW